MAPPGAPELVFQAIATCDELAGLAITAGSLLGDALSPQEAHHTGPKAGCAFDPAAHAATAAPTTIARRVA
jgi:hypothetical protein